MWMKVIEYGECDGEHVCYPVEPIHNGGWIRIVGDAIRVFEANCQSARIGQVVHVIDGRFSIGG